jgi:uncharacterized coiled-coil protein SlyX
MDNDLGNFLHNLIPFAVFGFPTATVIAFRWFRHRERMAMHEAPPRVAELEARLARMEQTLDAVAVEMERMSDGQRFVTRLLADRRPAAVATPPAARVQAVTPH